MTDYDRIITAIKADIEKQKETAVNPSARIFIGGEMRAIEIIEELKMESAGTQITNSNLKSESEIKVDLIRREAVLDTLDRMNKALDTDRTVEQYHKLLKACFEVLPAYSANLVKESGVLVKDLVKDGDLISRKAVLDFTTEWCNRCGKRKEYDGVMCKCCDLADTIDFVEELHTIPQTAIKHFGAMECPNCGALFYEVPMIETVLEEIKDEILDETAERVIEVTKVISILNKHISGKE